MLFTVFESINLCHAHVLGGGFASRRRTERFYCEQAISALIHMGQKLKKSSKRLHQSVTLKSVFAAVFLLLVTPYYQSVKLWGGFGHLPLEIPIANELAPSRYQSRMSWLWGGFGEALGGFAEAWGGFGSFWSFKTNLGATFGRLWETLGDSGVAFGEALGGFGEALGGFGDALEGFGEALGGFGRLWGCPPPVAEQNYIQKCWEYANSR